ncbi:MAG: glycosyltransferase [Flavobacteriales bacterium]|nr:glycosyltransferase [Flavobacteriales bacterium]
MKKDISIVIPLLNEEESLVELNDWIKKVMTEYQYSYEVLYIDDGSTDNSWTIIEELNQKDTAVRGIKFRRNYGKSAALNIGFAQTIGDVVFTMDADLQDSPEELPEMYEMITKKGFHIVSGWKQKRFDPLSKTIPTKLFNWATRKMTGIYLHDFNCGLKAYQSQVVKNIEVYGEMHRYIPAIAKWAGFTKITEKVVSHQERKYGVTKFGLERFINGFLDLLSINFVGKFGKRPMHFFGTVGTIVFFFGFIMALYIGAEKLYYMSINVRARLVTEIPQFYIALISMVIGVQLFLAGFLAELVSRNSPSRNNYKVEKEL